MGKYIICKASNGQYWWVLEASNGETLLTSETINICQRFWYRERQTLCA